MILRICKIQVFLQAFKARQQVSLCDDDLLLQGRALLFAILQRPQLAEMRLQDRDQVLVGAIIALATFSVRRYGAIGVFVPHDGGRGASNLVFNEPTPLRGHDIRRDR